MKRIIALSLIIILLFANTISALAATETVSKGITYRNIKITYNGESLTPTDANGNPTEPFIMDGSTYLPVRAIATALGLDVEWDGKTNTVILKDKAPSSAGKSIGSTTMVDNFECKIKEVNWYSASDFDYDIIERDEGFEYIVVVLSEKNTTNDTENAPTSNLLSADGKECNKKVGLSLYKKQYKINFGATMAGSTAEAYVIYQIPKGAKSFKFQILSNGFGAASDYIEFSRDDIK